MSLEDQSSFTLGFQGFHTLFRPTSDNSARATAGTFDGQNS